MKILSAKRLILVTCVAAAMFMFGCKPESEAEETPAYTITAQEGYENTITVDDAAGTITLAPAVEGIEYTITGVFEGQIINKTKNTVITLDGANLKNTEGKAVIYGEAKIELKFKKDSTNTITVTGTDNTVYEEGKPDFSKAAVLCEKAIEIGGSGSCTISCENGHGVKGSKIELKGSGTYTFDGGDDSSGLNCNSFIVKQDEEKPRTFTAILKDSKNGIKADETIEIACGTFDFKNITGTALKTDKKDKKGAEPADHYIHLTGGTFTFTDCTAIYETKDDSFEKSETVIGDFTNPL